MNSERYMSDGLLNYFDRLSIVHLPERTDRLASLIIELSTIGIDVKNAKIHIPHAPKPETPNGFPSRGVYGNFLSHLRIIEQAYSDNLDNILIMEDDAIFCRSFSSKQATISRLLRSNKWDTV